MGVMICLGQGGLRFLSASSSSSIGVWIVGIWQLVQVLRCLTFIIPQPCKVTLHSVKVITLWMKTNAV